MSSQTYVSYVPFISGEIKNVFFWYEFRSSRIFGKVKASGVNSEDKIPLFKIFRC